MNEPTIELTGYLGFDPELRYTPNGVAVCDLRLAVTPRRKLGEEWQDGETMWFTAVCWRQLAENAAQSFRKGDRVFAAGRLQQQQYDRADGTLGSKLIIDATAVGAEISRCPVKVLRPVRENSAASVLADKFAAGGPLEGAALTPDGPDVDTEDRELQEPAA